MGIGLDAVANQLDQGKSHPVEYKTIKQICEQTTFLFIKQTNRIEYPKATTERERVSSRTRLGHLPANIRKKLTMPADAFDSRRVFNRAYTSR